MTYCIIHRIEGKKPTLARAVAIGAEDCLLEIFRPIGNSQTLYSEEILKSGTYERSVILACKVPVVTSETTNTGGEKVRSLKMYQTPLDLSSFERWYNRIGSHRYFEKDGHLP